MFKKSLKRKKFFQTLFFKFNGPLWNPWDTNNPQDPLNEWLGHIAPALLKGALMFSKQKNFREKDYLFY
jgi:hypothetical protein